MIIEFDETIKKQAKKNDETEPGTKLNRIITCSNVNVKITFNKQYTRPINSLEFRRNWFVVAKMYMTEPILRLVVHVQFEISFVYLQILMSLRIFRSPIIRN